MAAMRTSLSEIDVSAGEVTYPPDGTLGPRRQDDLQLVLVHRGSATITVDHERPFVVDAGEVALLLPGHRETFAFDGTHHSWIQAHVGEAGEPFTSLPRSLPLSGALADLVAEAVAVTRTPTSTSAGSPAPLTSARPISFAASAPSSA